PCGQQVGYQDHLLLRIIPQRAAVFKAPYTRFFSERHPHYQQMTQILEGHCSGLFNHEIHGIHEKAQHCFRVVRVVRGLDF
ncbi:MAG: hypothetical protein PHG74_13830, partial [Kiritimatiellae bacterium]|nr:hypothetical protein [Kiritimatiellia bacterium]